MALLSFEPEVVIENIRYVWNTIEPFDLNREVSYFHYAYSLNKYIDIPKDLSYTLMWFLVITAVHLITRIFVFKPLALRYLPVKKEASPSTPGKKGARARDSKPSPPAAANGGPSNQEILKFQTACWKGSSYTFLVFFAIFCMWGEDWPLHTALYWRGWPMDITFWVKQLYYVEFAYYFHATIVILWEPKMKDTAEMLLHHLATVSLMALSYCWGYYRIGAAIMLLHDVSDPWMEFAKLFNYMKSKLADVLFAIFAISFIFTRWYVYPAHVLRSVWAEARDECPYCCGWWVFIVFLAILQILHIFWGILILKILYTAIVHKGVQGDIREEESDEKAQE